MSPPTDRNDGKVDFTFLSFKYPQITPPDQKPQKNLHVTIGNDLTSNQQITIGDIERRSGLYVLGISGMGKSTMLVNLMVHDIQNGHGLFFLDPHGDAIFDVVDHAPSERIRKDAILFDLDSKEWEECSFGINLLACKNVDSRIERRATYTRAYNVFHKLWEDEWGPWFQLILENTLLVFIENQDYTLAEVPLFLTNAGFRNYLLENVRHNQDAVDFWRYEFGARRERDQEEQVQSTLTRVRSLLNHDDVRHIVGQRRTTIDFADIMEKRKIVFIRLHAKLSADIKKFVGTILISELAHAAMDRSDRHQFCVFVDEFQNFTYSDDFNTLFTQARKYGIATTIAHQERYGQLGKNQKILGATAAAANKVIFQATERDAQELAPGFASLPPQETKQEPGLVLSSEPFWDLVRHGHGNPVIQACVHEHLRPIVEIMQGIREKMETKRHTRTAFQDEATLHRDVASIHSVDDRQIGMIRNPIIREAMQSAYMHMMSAHVSAGKETEELISFRRAIESEEKRIYRINELLLQLMQRGINPGVRDERLATFLHNFYGSKTGLATKRIVSLYIDLRYGNLDIPRSIPGCLAVKHWPEELEDAYLNFHASSVKKLGLEECRRRYRKGIAKPLAWANAVKIEIEKEDYSWDLEFYEERLKRGDTHNTAELPDLPARVFDETEAEQVMSICRKEYFLLLPRSESSRSNVFRQLADLVEFCKLLAQPINHVRVRSGHYVDKPVNTRTVADMTNEAAHELSRLPKYTAFAKIIEEGEGRQEVSVRRMQTVPLLALPYSPLEYALRRDARKSLLQKAGEEGICRPRSDIEEEIRQRRDRWRGGGPTRPRLDEPPPTSF